MILEHYRELALLKQRNADLKLSIRLGGKSGQYTRHLKKSKSAKQLVRSLMWFMASYGFDGVDVALEFPDDDVPEDKLALTTLLEVKVKLDFQKNFSDIVCRKLGDRNDRWHGRLLL